jgi:hypothetical protein
VERVIGTIRRECLDHLIVFNERNLHRQFQAFVESSKPHSLGIRSFTWHWILDKDTPEPRLIQLPESGRIGRRSEHPYRT